MYMERSVTLQIYFCHLYEKFDRLPTRVKENNVEIIIVIATKSQEQHNVVEKIHRVCSEFGGGLAPEDMSVS